MEADGRGAGAWVVGKFVGVLEGTVRGVVVVRSVFVGLELPRADARVCGRAAHEHEGPRSDVYNFFFFYEGRGGAKDVRE